jgi:Dolichyl-phosphate-mannose-protein mannosyltransferase
MAPIVSKIKPVFLLLLINTAAGWLYSYAMQGPGIDREVFRYAGMALANGETPYIAFFDHKPPVIYFIYLLAHPFGVYGPQIIFTGFSFLVSLLVYKCCRQWLLQRYALLLTILWIVMLHDPFVMADGGQNRHFSALITTVIICHGFIKENSINWLLLGILSSLLFFTQQTDFPALLPFLLWLIMKEGNAFQKRKRIGLWLTGFALITGMIWSWFYSRNAHQQFWYCAFTFNSSWYIDHQFIPSKISYVAVMLVKTGYLFSLAALIFLRRSVYRMQAFVVLLGGFIQALVLIPGFFFNHYFIACIPWVFFAWALLVRQYLVQHSAVTTKKEWWLPVAVVLLMLFHIKPVYWLKKDTATVEKRLVEKMKPYVREVQNQPGQFFAFDQTPFLSLNATYNIVSPSRWLYFHFWLRPNWDERLDTFKTDVLNKLDQYNCTYIIDRDNGVTFFHPALKQLWEEYTRLKYELIFEEKSATGKRLFRLLKRKQNQTNSE